MRFARQSLGSLAALAFGLVVSIVLPRVLGAEARGEYQLAVKVAALVLAVAQWGIPEVLLQLLAERHESAGSFVGTSLALGLIGALAVSAALVLLSPLLSESLLGGVDSTLLLVALGGSLFSIVGLLGRRFIQLQGRLDVYNALDVGRTALFLVLVLAAAAAIPRDALGPTVAWLVAEVALAALALVLVLRSLSNWSVRPALARELMHAGAPIQLSLVAMFVGSEGGAFVLNASLGVAMVGIYSVALAVSRLVLQISGALRTTLQPRLVGPDVDSAAITATVTRHGVLWMLVLAVGLAVGSPLVPLIFTDEFAAAGPALVLLLPGRVAYGVWQLVASHLLRIGRRGLLAGIAWLFAVMSIGLQAAGALALGLPGAAAGLTVAYLVATAVALFAFVRLSGHGVRDLVPAPSDLAFYVGLTRRALATLG